MGLLLLLGFLFSLQDLQLGGATANQAFEFESVTLSIEPSNAVARGTDVTLRCKAKVLTAGPWALRREYVLSRDGEVLYNKTTSSSQDFLLQLPDARVSSNGRYQCNASLEGQRLASGRERLVVSGVSTPVLQVNRTSIREGEEVLAHCSAPGETGSILVYFFVDSKEVQEHRGTPALARLRLGGGSHRVHCSYTVVLKANSVESEPSPPVTVTVTELFAPPLLEIFPGEDSVFEGDLVIGFLCGRERPPRRGTRPPPFGRRSLERRRRAAGPERGRAHPGPGGGGRGSTTACRCPPGPGAWAFQCRLVVGGLKKAADRTVHVRELFSAPSLRMSPPEVFQKEPLTLTCSVDAVAEKLDRSELNYTLLPIGIRQRSGSFALRTLLSDFNYSCAAEARGVRKYSSPLTVRPKGEVFIFKRIVFVLIYTICSLPEELLLFKGKLELKALFCLPPEISASGLVVLGRPFQVLCRSLRGSLPINYTLSRGPGLDRAEVHRAQDRALFSVTVQNPDEVRQLRCEASNHGREGPLSPELNATVIGQL
ncbi:LOW QUALITY PROTEIN: platelet endothelial cell adhesion molecule-like, partial [Menidia menidia]